MGQLGLRGLSSVVKDEFSSWWYKEAPQKSIKPLPTGAPDQDKE